MTLDEAALRWGKALLEVGEDAIGGGSDQFLAEELDAFGRVHRALCSDDPWEWRPADLACVMYAQDVAEGRHG